MSTASSVASGSPLSGRHCRAGAPSAAGEPDGGDRCLAALKADVRRLAAAAA
jgi:hypothetical protein